MQALKRLIQAEKSDREKAKFLIGLSDLLSGQNPEEGVFYGKEGVKLAAKLNNTNLLVEGLTCIGVNYLYASQLDSAGVYFHKATAMKVQPHYSANNIKLSNLLGSLHSRKNCWDSTWYYWQRSLTLATESGNLDYLAGVYSNLGTLVSNRGDQEQAISYFHEALRYYEQIDNKKNMAIVLNNIGQVNHAMGDLERAIDYTLRAAMINEQIQSYFNLSMNYGNLGTFYQDKQMPDEAENYFLKSLEIANQNGFFFDKARALLNLGMLYLNVNQLERALDKFTESLSISQELEISIGIAMNYLGFVDYYTINGDFDKALDYLNKTNDIAIEFDLTEVLLTVYEKRPSILEKQNKFEQALHDYQKYVQFKDSMNILANRTHVEEMQTRYESERKELENQQLLTDIESNKRIILKQRIILVLVVILALTIFRNRQKVKKTNLELNELNKMIMLQNKQLEELNNTKDILFSIIAHDLKAPFNNLLGFLQMLMDDFDSYSNTEKKEMVELVYHQSNNTYSLLENLLQWAMTQRGQISYFPAERDIAILIQSELEFLSNRAKKKNIIILNHIVANTTAWVDSNLFKIIIRNIVNNAIKFTERNGTIKLEAFCDNEFVLIRIMDNGVGMTEEQMNKLLEMKPVKANKGTENELGSGLGLLLVKEFVEMHKAKIHIESSPGIGTIFTLSFHLKQPSN